MQNGKLPHKVTFFYVLCLWHMLYEGWLILHTQKGIFGWVEGP